MIRTPLPVVLTATIEPAPLPKLALADPLGRWYQYRDALNFWLSRPSVRQIVWCENSGYPIDFSLVLDQARKAQKDLEILSYPGNEETRSKGRGYGEGEILRYAIENSRVLTNTPGFFKATGRLIIENFETLSRSSANHPVVISERTVRHHGWADTRFYKMDRDFYCRHLINVHADSDNPEWILGRAYAKVLGPLRIPSFRRAIRVRGTSGNGQSYEDSEVRHMLKSAAAISGYYQIKF